MMVFFCGNSLQIAPTVTSSPDVHWTLAIRMRWAFFTQHPVIYLRNVEREIYKRCSLFHDTRENEQKEAPALTARKKHCVANPLLLKIIEFRSNEIGGAAVLK
jgi:hypothetical protein